MVGKVDLIQVLDLLFDSMDYTHQDLGCSRDAVVCADGFRMSVQAGKSFYCSPRHNTLRSREYDTWEIGFPSEPEELIREYAEDPNDLTGTVYGNVPIAVIKQVFKKHGGLHPAEAIRLKKIQKQVNANRLKKIQLQIKTAGGLVR